jgi:hypothetical protein
MILTAGLGEIIRRQQLETCFSHLPLDHIAVQPMNRAAAVPVDCADLRLAAWGWNISLISAVAPTQGSPSGSFNSA